MTGKKRTTVIVHGRHAMRDRMLHASREGLHGLQVMNFEQAACRLAGGFIGPIDMDSLRDSIGRVLPDTRMEDLESIKHLPGMVGAAANTLHKVWRSGLDLGEYAKEASGSAEAVSRLKSISELETAVLEDLPSGMLRPIDIVKFAKARISHAELILGSMEFSGLTHLSSCWMPLLSELASQVPVKWNAGPREIPEWLNGLDIEVLTAPAEAPDISVVSTATPYHEAIEAMRWARQLVSEGRAKPAEIAIATTSTKHYDGYFHALREDANVDLHFVHGISPLAMREGQAAAALADIVVRGLTHDRLRRLRSVCWKSKLFKNLPDGWLNVLPKDAPLTNPDSWNRLFSGLKPEDWPDGKDCTDELKRVVSLLERGGESAEAAEGLGKEVLDTRARRIWQKALIAGPVDAIDTYLDDIRQFDRLESSTCIAWMPSYEIASCPRRFVRLIGLNSNRWPRGASEDRLIPDHVIPVRELDPIPMNIADRRDFKTIRATTAGELVLSFARRGADGRQMGQSPLLFGLGDPQHVRRSAVPGHAFSETDRLMARPEEFKTGKQAASARICWIDWCKADITAHDGLVRKNHPLISQVLTRVESASSLSRLLRNPIGYAWVYGFGWREPDSILEPLLLSPLEFGELVHDVLDRALQDIEAGSGLDSAGDTVIRDAVASALDEISEKWMAENAIPPKIIWQRKLKDVREMAVTALNYRNSLLQEANYYGEIPFGLSDLEDTAERNFPWDVTKPVTIPRTDVSIAGRIDRLDLSKDGKQAHVCDYKTGRAPKKNDFTHKGGSELQRCLYAFAVKDLLGGKMDIQASLFYPREEQDFPLEDPESVLDSLKDYIVAAKSGLADGKALPGIDAGDAYDDLAFALPAVAVNIYKIRKEDGIMSELSGFAGIWEEK